MKINFVICVIISNVIYGANAIPQQNTVSNETYIDRLKSLFKTPSTTMPETQYTTESTTQPTPSAGSSFTSKTNEVTSILPITPTITEENCTCVSYELCKPAQSKMDQACPNAIDVCCLGGENLISTSTSSPPCECVLIDHCDNGENTVDLRLDTKKHPCSSYLEICCSLAAIISTKPIACPSVGCGIRNSNGVGFNITGDNNMESKFGEFPWMVAIMEEKTTNPYVCGGSLIHPSVVLTAAHCIDRKTSQSLKIRAGEWDTQTTREPHPYQDRSIRRITTHPGYRRGFLHGVLYNDIALIFLMQPFDITISVNTICLPYANENFDESRCISTGWGKNEFGAEGKYQVILKRVELPVVSSDTCAEKLRRTRLGGNFQLHNSYMCAGGEPGSDTCTGDGGSPLVCPVKNSPGQYVQAGIVAWGIGCGGSTPGVYVDVSFFRDWVDEEMKLNHLSTQSYQRQ